MARVDGNLALEDLYRALMDRRLDFMPPGEHHIRRIYQTLTERHPELCDDSYLCSASCKVTVHSFRLFFENVSTFAISRA